MWSPRPFVQRDGADNAAIEYLKAISWAGKAEAFVAKYEFEIDNLSVAKSTDVPPSSLPPSSWDVATPGDLPLDEVKSYLSYFDHQHVHLNAASQMGHCDFGTSDETPEIDFLTEISPYQELAKVQSLRFRLAIAERRLADAIDVTRQQIALSRHLSQSTNLYRCLVGASVQTIAMNDMIYLFEQSDAPNFYWGVSGLPYPFIQISHAFENPNNHLSQSASWSEITEKPLSSQYWREHRPTFLADFLQHLNKSEDQTLAGVDQLTVATVIAASIPSAREYLLNSLQMEREQVISLSDSQVFFLAARRYSEQCEQDWLRLARLPIWQRNSIPLYQAENSNRHLFFTIPGANSEWRLRAALMSQARSQVQIALIQTVESIRHHLATHSGELPRSLDDLEWRAPYNPATNKPFNYLKHDLGATLTGSNPDDSYYQVFELRVD